LASRMKVRRLTALLLAAAGAAVVTASAQASV